MIFTDYIETSTNDYRKKWLDRLINEYRIRIESHLGGNRDKDLEKELEKKQTTIMNTDTIDRFMNGILKVDMIAQAIFEPNTRNVPKDIMLIEYLKENNVELEIIPNNNKSSNFGPHASIKSLKYNNYKIETAIWSSKSNDAGVYNKFRKIKTKTYKNPTILIADGPKIKKEYLESTKNINNLQIMNVEQFIKWVKQN
jgi:hypothetical protein